MPILVKDHTWTQSDTTVNIKVPLKSVHHDKVDLFTTDSYIKAHFNPFFFEVFLLHEVDIGKSKCIIKDELIIIDLQKREEIEWETLEKDLNKKEKMEHKQMVLEKCQEQAKQESEDRRIKKSQMDRFTVHQAMEIDTQQHHLIDSRRNAERNKAMNNLETWRLNSLKAVDDSQIIGDGVKILELPNDVTLTTNNNINNGVKIIELTDDIENKPKAKDNQNFDYKKSITFSETSQKEKRTPLRKEVKMFVKSEYVTKKKMECAKRVLPKMRDTAELEIRHTPRTFPTPSRESQANEEEEWLKNITLARRATGIVIVHC